MITSNATPRTGAMTGQPITFEGVGGVAALVAGIAGFLYAVAFIILKNAGLSALFLLLIGLFSLVALVALYGRLRHVDESAALLGLLFSLAGPWARWSTAATTWPTPSIRHRRSRRCPARWTHGACSRSAWPV